ncbi:MAG: ester cyclase [Candidatus Nanoarchaeia archaeon]|jgi:predicted ester cyclase
MNNEEIIKKVVNQIIQEGDLEEVKKYFSTKYVAYNGNKIYKGHDFIKKWVKQIRLAIPDVKVVKIEFLNKSEKIITWQRTFKGTHKKNMRGIPASGKTIKWTEMIVSLFENGKISEEWVVSELKGELLLKSEKK